MYRHLCLIGILCIVLLCSTAVRAQETISGIVLDAETGAPIDLANIVLQDGSKTIDYTITNAKGVFSIKAASKLVASTLIVSSMGYKTQKTAIGGRRSLTIPLAPHPFELKEVTIRRGRIWGSNDTIRFDAAAFLRANDKTVEDLMKRLPGINVDDNGDIQYNGKPIGSIYVEGLNMMGSRYKSVSKNLSAKSIKGVEVLDHHQRIKALEGKVPSDVTDINLKLKDDFKDKWNMTNKVSAGFAPHELLYELEANATQISKKSQSLYSLKLSNTGNGITKEADEGYSQLLPLPDYQLLYPNSLSAPLKEPRWLIEDAIIATANRLYKMGEDSHLKINAFYTHNNARQERSEVTTYFNPDGRLAVDEHKMLRYKEDAVHLSADYEDNRSAYFFRNKLKCSLSRSGSMTDISGSYRLTQDMDSRSFSLKDNVSYTKQLDGGTFTTNGIVGYWRKRQSIHFGDLSERHDLQGVYARSMSRVTVDKTKVRQLYTIGATLDFNDISTHHQLHLTPEYEYQFGSFRLSWGLPTDLIYIPRMHDLLLAPTAKTKLKYKINYAWSASASADYHREIGGISMLYDHPYFIGYRMHIAPLAYVPISTGGTYGLNLEYKNTVSALFIAAKLLHRHDRKNYTSGQEIREGIFYTDYHDTPHTEAVTSANLRLSKAMFDLNTKASLELSWMMSSSAQIRENKLIHFGFRHIGIVPKISFAPSSSTEIAYEGSIDRSSSNYGENHHNSLWSMQHKLSLYYTGDRLESSLTGEYFRNQVTSEQNVRLFYADFMIGYRFPRVFIRFSAKNIFNQKSYRYTLYNPLSVYSSEVSLRPREFLATVQFNI